MKSKECYFSPLNYSGKISPKSKKRRKRKVVDIKKISVTILRILRHLVLPYMNNLNMG